MKAALLGLLLLPALGSAEALPKPASVSVSPSGLRPGFQWDKVAGAKLYRVAVFGAPDEEGKRELKAAVWVKAERWSYGEKKGVVPKAAKLASIESKALQEGGDYHVMVSAAREDGADKSDWAGADFSLKGAPSKPLAEETPLPAVLPTATATPAADLEPQFESKGLTKSAEAVAEVDLAKEFKETPEPTETAPLVSDKAQETPSFEGARALLQSGKAEAAETVYRKILDQNPKDADAWEGLGDSFDARKMKVEAKDAYEKALDIDRKRDRLKKWLEDNVRR